MGFWVLSFVWILIFAFFLLLFPFWVCVSFIYLLFSVGLFGTSKVFSKIFMLGKALGRGHYQKWDCV
jgi:hypothetical protein